ncbi:conjugal transfer protein [Actinopolymorpha pittospori]|uniref:Conjugative transposon protein TcpC n=1 Tax=Actinopolymorpha pittospori TaxID=648752 RepID=A0A927N0V3_9ACTN|nr:conjugal transfer protein [Actinopolymorpha pittospori]MBE1609959.1 hypothetical protein [Actinopolymorpha pittospori]
MSPTVSLRRRAGVEEQNTNEDLREELPPIADGAHQTTSALAAKAATVGLMACLVLGPVGAVAGGLALAQSARPAPVQAATVTDRSNDQAVAGEFAQRVVLTWLTTTQDQPAPVLALVKDAQISAMSQQAFTTADPTVARIVQTDGTWSVTVAVTVTDARNQTARRFFQLPVQLTNGSVTALTLPTPVSPPTVVQGSTPTYCTQIGTSSPVGQTVAQFLTAYIAGSGDVSRYLTPGVALAALTPAPYMSVRLDDLRSTGDVDPAAAPEDDQRMRVLAVATASVTDKQSSSVAYALTLTARAGRWEITAIDPTPAVAAKTPPDPSTWDTTRTPTGSSAITPTPAGASSPAATTQ